ncbi:unnamed protein product, partial [Prorocentrum cordatum]
MGKRRQDDAAAASVADGFGADGAAGSLRGRGRGGAKRARGGTGAVRGGPSGCRQRKRKGAAASSGTSSKPFVGPLLIRYVSSTPIDKSKLGMCGYCACVEDEENAFPDVKMPGEPIAKFMHGCSYHFRGYCRGQWHLDHQWTQMCAQANEDDQLAEAFEATCEISDGKAFASAGPHDVSLKHDTGFTVYSDCVLITEQQYKKDIAPEGADQLVPSDAGERITELKNEHRSEKLSGVLVADPSQPYVKVRKWSSTYGSHSEWALQASEFCRDQQASGMADAIDKYTRELLPTALRGHVAAPTIAEVRKRAIGAARAKGLLARGPSTPHRPGDGDLGAETPLSGQGLGPRAICDIASSPAAASGLDGESASGAPFASPAIPMPARAHDAAGAVHDDLADEKSVVSAATMPLRRGKSSMDVGLDDPDKARFKELEANIDICRILNKGQHHGIGDKIYALARFNPGNNSNVQASKTRLTGLIETCTTLGGDAVDTMSREIRLNLLDQLKHRNIDGALNFKMKLVAAAVREATSITDKVNICIPWSVTDVSFEEQFLVKEPTFALVGIQPDKAAKVSREFIINKIVLPLTTKREADVDEVLEMCDAFSEHVGSDKLRDAVPVELKAVAQELYVFSESLKVLLDASPSSIMDCPCRVEARAFLREEGGEEDWRNVVFTFGTGLKGCLAEYSRACHSDIKHGKAVKEFTELLGRSDITIDNFVVVFDGLGEWGNQLRTGGANALLKAMSESLESWVKKLSSSDSSSYADQPAPDALRSMESRFQEFIGKAVDFRGVSSAHLKQHRELAAELRRYSGSVASAAQEDALATACRALAPENEESISAVRAARQQCVGMKFARASTVASMMACIEICLSRSAALSADTLSIACAVDLVSDEMLKLLGVAWALATDNIEASGGTITSLAAAKVRIDALFQFAKLLKARSTFDQKNGDLVDECAAEAWQELRATAVRFKEAVWKKSEAEATANGSEGAPSDGQDKSPAMEGYVINPEFEAYERQFSAVYGDTAAKLVDFSSTYWDNLACESVAKIKEFIGMAGGLLDLSGQHWSTSAADPNDFDCLQDCYKRVLCKQKGITTKLKHIETSELAKLEGEFKKGQRRAQATLWEARALQSLTKLTPDTAAEVLTTLRDTVHDSRVFCEDDVAKPILDKVSDELAKALNSGT